MDWKGDRGTELRWLQGPSAETGWDCLATLISTPSQNAAIFSPARNLELARGSHCWTLHGRSLPRHRLLEPPRLTPTFEHVDDQCTSELQTPV